MKLVFIFVSLKLITMKVIMRSKLIHEAPKNGSDNFTDVQMKELKSILMDSLEGDKMCENADLKWHDDGTVEVVGANNNALHRFALKCEQFGKNISFERQTIIHVS